MKWKLWIITVGWLPVTMPGWWPPRQSRSWPAFPPEPEWIEDFRINWRHGPFNTSGSRGSYRTDLPYISRPLPLSLTHGGYRFLEIGFKVCGAHYKGFEVYLTAGGKHIRNKSMLTVRVTERTVETKVKFCRRADLSCYYCEANDGRSGWRYFTHKEKHFDQPPYHSCKEERKLRIKWQEEEAWSTKCYLEPGVGEIFSSTFARIFGNWTNELIFSPLRDPTNEDDRGIWFHYRGRL